MESPKKGLLCNLNHVHLQHISLGLHLSRHPELREECHALAPPRKATGGREQSHVSALVDANSNDPTLTCQCCDEHPLHPGLKRDLQALQALPQSPVSDHEEEEDEDEDEEDEDSPLDLASSSASSCSDLSLDDSPVSVYWREFPAEEPAHSPENQPNIVPLDQAQSAASPGEGSAHLNDSPDSLGSLTSWESTPSPGSKNPPLESPAGGSPVPVRPCRAPPAVPLRRLAPGLDSNCNAVPVQEPKPETFPPGQVDVNLNPRPRVVGPPPPVPPRTKRGLQGIRRREPEPSTRDGDAAKNITSFHELAQKRKKVSATATKDQSDWLIVFSPDTELPPCHETMWGNVPNQKVVAPQTVAPELVDVAKEVTTFKELRCRKQKSPLPLPAQEKVKAGDPLQESDPEPPPTRPVRGPKENPLRKKKPRPGLQPIMEGGEDVVSDRRSEGKTDGPRDPWMPGKAEGAGGRPAEVQHSQSFGGIATNGHPWRADVDRLSAQLREQKKALLVAVSVSVDRIVAHFSTARNLVQKAQLGDSRLSPDVGYLVLSTLCPALWALVGDGLKPFQKDVIMGQRPSSPWSVVEASAKPGGPPARSLTALYWRVSRLAPLRSSQQRFHAFILGLLNLKQLEQWFAHLQQNSELILALYVPTAFLVLSQGLCRGWADELLLLLQPLSMLTFQLDLLFEHHHLPFSVRPMPRRAITPTEPLTGGSSKAGGLRWLDVPPPLVQPGPGPAQGSQAEAPLRQRLLQWGDRLTYTLIGNEASSETEPGPQATRREMEEKQQSWWQQLTLSSGVYANATPVSKQESFPHTQWAKLRVAVGGALQEARVSVAAAAGSSSAGPRPATEAVGGSPKAGAATELEAVAPNARGSSSADSQEAVDSPGSGKGKRLGWLFGANCPGASSEPDQSLPKSGRRPSSWLPPTMNVLALVMKTVPAEKSWQKDPWEDVSPDPLQAYRAVRALCDHVGSEDNQLSFCKGDVLQVLDTVDEDWLQCCCQGGRRGLVPVGYTSLIL